MAERDTTLDVGQVHQLTYDEIRRAALTVCARAHDVDDARELLETLGLAQDLRHAQQVSRAS